MSKVLLIVVIVALTVFCVFNLQPTAVWPFRTPLPLFAIVLAAFAVGLGIGWVGHVVSSGRRRRPARAEEALDAAAKGAGPVA